MKAALVIRHRDANWADKTDAERNTILRDYFAWFDDLRARDICKAATSLSDDGGYLLHAVDGEVVDGPFTETKEIVGGFVLIEVDDWQQARRIAATCPAVNHGDIVELREVVQLERP